MKKYLNLQSAALKEYFRNKEALFWTLVFPLIFLVIFGWFDTGNSVNAYIAVVDDSNSQFSDQIVESLQSIDGIGITKEYSSVEDAQSDLEKSKNIDFEFIKDGEKHNEKHSLNVVLYFPSDYGQIINQANSNTTSQATIFFNESDEGAASPSAIVGSIIEDITNEINLQIIGRTNLFSIERKGLSVNEIGYFDILMPGIIGMGIMQSGIIGMASTIAVYKEKHVLKRLSATPLPNWQYLLAEVLTFMFISFIQITIMLTIGTFVLGANVYGSVPLVYLIGIGGSFVFLSLGFIAASLTSSSNAAAGLSNAMSVPMMFLSGVFFLRDGLPPTVKFVADYLPLSPVIDSLRDVILLEASIQDLQTELTIIFVWTIVAFLLASRLFKFREE